jgi:hypothetical protein
VVQSTEYREISDNAGRTTAFEHTDGVAKILAETYEQKARISLEFELQL